MNATRLSSFLSRLDVTKAPRSSRKDGESNEDDGTVQTASVTTASDSSIGLSTIFGEGASRSVKSCSSSANNSVKSSRSSRSSSARSHHHRNNNKHEHHHEREDQDLTQIQEEKAFLQDEGIINSNVEKVWFTSVNERFQRYQKAQVFVDGNSSSDDDEDGETFDSLATNTPLHLLNSSNHHGDALERLVSEKQYFAHLDQSFHSFCDAQTVEAKKVRFNLDENVLIESPLGFLLEEEEIEESWYSEEQVDLFRENTVIVSRAFLLQNKPCLQTFAAAFQFCSKKRNERSHKENTLLRAKLAKLYMDNETSKNNSHLVGLEHVCLTSIRGDVKKLRQFCLDHAWSIVQTREQTTGEVTEDQAHAIIAHISQCVSKPSKVMAYEMAVAQAYALQQE
eukprot:CAMPEP_0198149528 /NCGR_PEP_ID=MMETSP1443-20131203/47063_1 /TAXON_ID=186043 /ORGANISM="Entomoneis sp., Strain CCMP2396" /LENGTH=394 /DNA_ID=CAMNT_0043814605 /DNA_START=55 /DNA_END=1239 /DNA_ORIENTATION=+